MRRMRRRRIRRKWRRRRKRIRRRRRRRRGALAPARLVLSRVLVAFEGCELAGAGPTRRFSAGEADGEEEEEEVEKEVEETEEEDGDGGIMRADAEGQRVRGGPSFSQL